MAQPIRIDDSVQLENEVGSVEEITSTYVVVRLWALRRLIVPLTYFIEKPFQNWSRESTRRIGAMSLHVDYAAPVERIRAKAIEIVQASPRWDGQDLIGSREHRIFQQVDHFDLVLVGKMLLADQFEVAEREDRFRRLARYIETQ